MAADLPKIDISDHLDEEQIAEIRAKLADRIDEPAMMVVGVVEPSSQGSGFTRIAKDEE